MKKRVTLKATWMVHVQDHAEGLPFGTIEHYKAYAQDRLVRGFSHYNPDLKIEAVDVGPSTTVDLAITWEVDLDMVKGTFHQPEDHAELLKRVLHTDIRAFSCIVFDILIDDVPYLRRRTPVEVA